jgi:hypothetical protein
MRPQAPRRRKVGSLAIGGSRAADSRRLSISKEGANVLSQVVCQNPTGA